MGVGAGAVPIAAPGVGAGAVPIAAPGAGVGPGVGAGMLSAAR